MNTDKVRALLNPTSIAILGARENPTGWTARIFANLQRFAFDGPVWPVNPRHGEIWGVTCYPDLAALPEAPDHLVVMRAAATAADTLREAAAMGTRSATLYAAGFSEAGTEEGRRLEDGLRKVIEETGIAVSGPNCLGNLSARARLLTLPDDRMRDLVRGPVAMVGQSGTTTPGIGRAVIDRGIDIGTIVTSGNEVGLATADYIDYFVDDEDVRVIFCLIEAVRRPGDFLAACRRARDAGKPVVALKMGVSEGGRQAALAHTGSLAGSVQAFDAVAGEAGVIRVESADAAINLIDYLVHSPFPKDGGVGALVISGGVRGLALDAADRYGVDLPAFGDATLARLRELVGEGVHYSNPLDAAGFLNQPIDVLKGMIQALEDDPAIGVILLHEDLPPTEGLNDANRRRAERVISTMEALDRDFVAKGSKPIALISAQSYDLTEFSRAARARFSRISCLNEPDRAFRTLAQVNRYRALTAAEPPSPDGPTLPAETVAALARGLREAAAGGNGPVALNEPDSKAVLRAYGVPIPDEIVAADPDEAVAAARRIGYPVVIKGIAAALTHKSDAGAVKLGLADEGSIHIACRSIRENLARYDAAIALEGFLVAAAVPGGLELVLGVHRDPEMGPVVMFGTGGILLELTRDVAFAPPGLSRDRAERLVDETRAGVLLGGYRGERAYDRDGVIEALVALGRLAADLGNAIESVDINPFVALPQGQGAFALDALVVARDLHTEGQA